MVEAPRAIAQRAAKLLLPKTITVLLETAALPAVAQFDLALVQTPHEFFIYRRKHVAADSNCRLRTSSIPVMIVLPCISPLRFSSVQSAYICG